MQVHRSAGHTVVSLLMVGCGLGTTVMKVESCAKQERPEMGRWQQPWWKLSGTASACRTIRINRCDIKEVSRYYLSIMCVTRGPNSVKRTDQCIILIELNLHCPLHNPVVIVLPVLSVKEISKSIPFAGWPMALLQISGESCNWATNWRCPGITIGVWCKGNRIKITDRGIVRRLHQAFESLHCLKNGVTAIISFLMIRRTVLCLHL